MSAPPTTSRKKRIRAVALTGFAGYALSYLLPAVHAHGSEWRGWEAALLTLNAVLNPPGSEHALGPYLAVLVSGWINPLFLVTFVLALRNPAARSVAVLRLLLLLMFGACWFVFRVEHATPAAGYFVWIVSMAIALFADRLVPTEDEAFRLPGPTR